MSDSPRDYDSEETTSSYWSGDRQEVPTDLQLLEDGAGTKLELKSFDVRLNSRGQRVVLQTGTRYNLQTLSDTYRESAIMVTKNYTEKNKLYGTTITIRSPYMITALKEVVGWYPDVSFDGNPVVLSDVPRCLFHYRKELKEYDVQSHDDDAVTRKEHVAFALKYMNDVLASDMQHYKDCTQRRKSDASLDWERLWMAYKPGDVILCRENDELSAGRLLSMEKSGTFLWQYWELELERLVCVGANMAYQAEEVRIYHYPGIKRLQDLDFYPVRFDPNQSSTLKELRQGGERLFDLRGVHQKYYRGHAQWARDAAPGKEDSYCKGHYPTTKFRVKGRIMVDAGAFIEHRPNHQQKTYCHSRGKSKQAVEENLEEQYLICHTDVFGYSLTDKRWCAFNVRLIRPIAYSGSAFNSLLLPTDLKATLLSLVEVHTNEALQFGDLIQDKGKGMIFLLHGEPGTGKTLTAESICDYVKRPLYPLRSGDLGISAEALESNLAEAFDLGERWDAIILLDEADVFLEARRRNELLRNSLVSVFLRALEYYEGIMFLTTNRIDSFDPAFKSRIHLSLKYPVLTQGFRRDLWANFINTGVAEDVDPSAQDEHFLTKLSEYEFNGRQIRNAVRTAYALAVSWDEELSDVHITTTLSAISTFDEPDDDDTEHDAEQRDLLMERRSNKRRKIS